MELGVARALLPASRGAGFQPAVLIRWTDKVAVPTVARLRRARELALAARIACT